MCTCFSSYNVHIGPTSGVPPTNSAVCLQKLQSSFKHLQQVLNGMNVIHACTVCDSTFTHWRCIQGVLNIGLYVGTACTCTHAHAHAHACVYVHYMCNYVSETFHFV